MKITLTDLVIEVTRRCNMGCAHCLRGDSQDLDLNTEYIDRLLRNVDRIGTITFSGGEPSLNLAAIEYTLAICKHLNIEVGGFYIVTNGKTNILPLSIVALKWYAYCYEKELCGLALSKDMFHDNIDPDNEEILRGLSFFREDKFTDFETMKLIYSGRAEELGGFETVNVDWHNEELSVECYDGQYCVESMIYLSANGDIRTNCDTAYEDDEYVIGNIQDNTLKEIIDIYVVAEEENLKEKLTA
jgi:MoaA/NifB/PqqE/SkfB family radical SAM enzyme